MKRVPQQLTKLFLRDNKVFFFPQSEEESTYIQEGLFALGAAWAEGQTYPILQSGTVINCIQCDKLVLRNRSDIKVSEGYFGTAEDFTAQPEMKKFVPVEIRWLTEVFNSIDERIKNVEAGIDRLDPNKSAPSQKIFRKKPDA